MGQRSRGGRAWRFGLVGLLVTGSVGAGSAATATPACGDRGMPTAGCSVEVAVDWSRAVPVTGGVCLRLHVEATLAATHDRQGVGGVGRERYGDLVLSDVRRTSEVSGSCTDDSPLATQVRVVSLGTIWARDADAGRRANTALSNEMVGWGSPDPVTVSATDYLAEYESWNTTSSTSTRDGPSAFARGVAQRIGLGGPGCLRLEVGYQVDTPGSSWGGSATEGAPDTTFCL